MPRKFNFVYLIYGYWIFFFTIQIFTFTGFEEESLKIRSDADRERVEILAESKKINEETRGQADAVATKIYADSYLKDSDFFKFLRSHDVYRDSLKEGTTLLMDAESEFFKYLK